MQTLGMSDARKEQEEIKNTTLFAVVRIGFTSTKVKGSQAWDN